jgi:25S rRNA (cytosine2278-C5)-methyltransferase
LKKKKLDEMNNYDDAAKLLKRVLASEGRGLKTIVYGNGDRQWPKMTLMLLFETLKYRNILLRIIASPNLEAFRREHSRVPIEQMLVRVYDVVVGSGLRGGGRLKKSIEKFENALCASRTRMLVRARVQSVDMLLAENVRSPVVLPRYVRVNSLLVESVDKAVRYFGARGFKLVDARSDIAGEFWRDADIGNLLGFAAGTDLHDDGWLKSGRIVLQDKASCLPAALLAPEPGAHVVDSCAAPGNKTSHLAALLGNRGRLFAFEKDARRARTLGDMLARARVDTDGGFASVHCADFLSTQPDTDERFADVRYLLVDPSCSGSGIVGRLDHLFQNYDVYDENETLPFDARKQQAQESAAEAEKQPAGQGRSKAKGKGKAKQARRKRERAEPRKGDVVVKDDGDDEKDRLQRLAAFQTSIVLHAMRFPNAQRVIYSTCSIHAEENERVVQSVLEQRGGDFELVNVLPTWKNRGVSIGNEHFDRHCAPKCLRAVPKEDHTIGFFVALFQRKSNKRQRS